MKRIGVRELRQRASEFLVEVERGQTLEVTVHGRPIARLVPMRQPDQRGRLAAGGRLAPGSGDLLGLGSPLAPAPRAPRPSRQLARARRHER